MTIVLSVAGGLCGGLAAAMILRCGWRDLWINLALGGVAGFAVSVIVLPASGVLASSSAVGFASAAFAGAATVLARVAYR